MELTYQVKANIKYLWKDRLNKRKMAYWNHLRCEQQADVYYSWMEFHQKIKHIFRNGEKLDFFK